MVVGQMDAQRLQVSLELLNLPSADDGEYVWRLLHHVGNRYRSYVLRPDLLPYSLQGLAHGTLCWSTLPLLSEERSAGLTSLATTVLLPGVWTIVGIIGPGILICNLHGQTYLLE